LPVKKPTQAPGRVVKDVEAHFRTVATQGDEFDHYRPAEFLTQKGIVYELADQGAALDRFEKLFKELNSLLPK